MITNGFRTLRHRSLSCRIRKAMQKSGVATPNEDDLKFLAEEVREDVAFVKETLGL